MGVKTAMGLPRDLFINPGLAEVQLLCGIY